jgi:hypothetical protein
MVGLGFLEIVGIGMVVLGFWFGAVVAALGAVVIATASAALAICNAIQQSTGERRLRPTSDRSHDFQDALDRSLTQVIGELNTQTKYIVAAVLAGYRNAAQQSRGG